MLDRYGVTPETQGAPVWIDLLNPSADEIQLVGNEYGVDVPSRDALEEIESSSRLRVDGQTLYMSMPLMIQDGDSLAPMPLGLILSPRMLISIRFSDMHALPVIKERLRKSGLHDPTEAFATLIDSMVDFSADVLEKISAKLAKLSLQVFGRHDAPPERDRRFTQELRDCLLAVGLDGEMLSRIRESLLGLQRIVGFVNEMAKDRLTPAFKARLHSARQDLLSLVDYEAHLSGKTQFLLDAVLGFINTEQNDIFKVLTIVSVVGIPPTLIASMYGMNFQHMPELMWRYGYPYALSLIAFSIIVPALWFKRRGWW